MQQLRSHSRILAHSDLAIAAIAQTTGLPTLVDPYSARVAIALGGMVARPILQTINQPIAIISRGAETLSLATNLFANTLIRQFASWSEKIQVDNPVAVQRQQAARTTRSGDKPRPGKP